MARLRPRYRLAERTMPTSGTTSSSVLRSKREPRRHPHAAQTVFGGTGRADRCTGQRGHGGRSESAAGSGSHSRRPVPWAPAPAAPFTPPLVAVAAPPPPPAPGSGRQYSGARVPADPAAPNMLQAGGCERECEREMAFARIQRHGCTAAAQGPSPDPPRDPRRNLVRRHVRQRRPPASALAAGRSGVHGAA